MDRSKLSIKKNVEKRKMSVTESDTELLNVNEEITSGQKPAPQVIPINFNLGSLDEELDDDTDTIVINECVEKVNELLSWRHHTATLTRDLRRYKEDELPSYARLHKVTFNPQLGSEETEKFFREKVQDFNRKMKTEFRETMLESAVYYSEKLKSDSEQLWKEACANISNGNNIPKLNNKIQELKEKWADEYRRAVNRSVVKGNHENQGSNRNEQHKGTDISEIRKELAELKKKTTKKEEETELEKLKREMEELKNNLMPNRKNRFNNRDNRYRGNGRRNYYN